MYMCFCKFRLVYLYRFVNTALQIEHKSAAKKAPTAFGFFVIVRKLVHARTADSILCCHVFVLSI